MVYILVTKLISKKMTNAIKNWIGYCISSMMHSSLTTIESNASTWLFLCFKKPYSLNKKLKFYLKILMNVKK